MRGKDDLEIYMNMRLNEKILIFWTFSKPNRDHDGKIEKEIFQAWSLNLLR